MPHVNGALVVNVGSLLSGWTRGELRATLHRVAGPASPRSRSPAAKLRAAVAVGRTSLAFFADPNEGVSLHIREGNATSQLPLHGERAFSSVAEYIRFRSGGEALSSIRSGVAFTKTEAARVQDT